MVFENGDRRRWGKAHLKKHRDAGRAPRVVLAFFPYSEITKRVVFSWGLNFGRGR